MLTSGLWLQVKELVDTLCTTYSFGKERAEEAVRTKCRNLAKLAKPAAEGEHPYQSAETLHSSIGA